MFSLKKKFPKIRRFGEFALERTGVVGYIYIRDAASGHRVQLREPKKLDGRLPLPLSLEREEPWESPESLEPLKAEP